MTNRSPGLAATFPSDAGPGGQKRGEKKMTEIFRESFESGNWHHNCRVFPVGGTPYEMETGNIFVPDGWTFWFRHSDEWSQPEGHHCWIDGDPVRVHSGNGAYMYFAFHRKMDAGLMRQVSVVPGADLRLTAYAHAWSNHNDPGQPDVFPHPDDPRWSEGDGVGYEHFFGIEDDVQDDGARNFTFSIGIDPTGGTDPFSDTVVWGEGAHIYNAYHEAPNVRVEAQSDVVTVFLRSVTLWPFKHNDAYWDDVALEQLGIPEPPQDSDGWAYNCVETGSKLGIHGINQNQIVSFCGQAAQAGAPFPVVKAVDDLGWLAQVKQVSPTTITIGRLTGPNEGCQGVGLPGADLAQMAQNLIQPILQRLTQEPRLADVVDYWEVANEPDPNDPDGVTGYAALARLMIHCMDLAEQYNLKLALFSLNMGTPEWVEMVAMVDTGVFSRAYLGGHILCLHEGPQDPNQLIDLWWGDSIPDAPQVDGAGACHFRYRYLYEAIRQAGEPIIPLVISEWYGGLHLPTVVPSFNDMVSRVEWWDEWAREDYWVWGCCPFTLGPVSQWVSADWERYYPALIDYAINTRNDTNAQPPVDVEPPPVVECQEQDQYERIYVLIPENYDSLWWQCVALGAHPRRLTTGTSAQDAGNPICLNSRSVLAINPADIGTGLTQDWFNEHYPGAIMSRIDAGTPYEAAVKLLPPLMGDISQAQDWYDVDFGEHPGGGTIEEYGCLLTACTIVLRSIYNKDITPPWLDRLFVLARSVFSLDHILNWEEFVELFPVFDSFDRTDGPTTVEWLRDLLENNWQVVLRRGSPGSAHFVYLNTIGTDGTINVIDTQDGQRKTWALPWITGIRAAHVAQAVVPSVPPLVGIHDEAGGEWMRQQGMTGCCLVHFNVVDSVVPVDFRHLSDNGIKVIARVNRDYGGGIGTIPPPGQEYPWIDNVAQTILNAQGVDYWIIGNEQDSSAEGPIDKVHYVNVYNAIWDLVAGRAKLTPGAIDPYNVDSGDPRDYVQYIYENIHGLDLIALHGKTQGSEPAQCWSYDTFTDPPLIGRYYHLRTLEDQLSWIPQRFRGVPVYVTELNPQRKLDGSNGWQGGAVGAEWVQEAYRYCASLNRIAGVMFYRWSDDDWAIQNDAQILGAIRNL